MKYLIGVIFIFTTLCALGQPVSKVSAKDVLERYLSMDYGGARLDGRTSGPTFQLVGWYEEPGWDELTFVISYSITKESVSDNEAKYIVQYKTAGRMMGEVIQMDLKTEEVEFIMQKKQGVWLIMDPRIEPHVNICVIKDILMKLSKDGHLNKNQNVDSAEQLEKLLNSCTKE